MDERSITQYIVDTFGGIDLVSASGDHFFYYDPDRKLPPERRLPFATIMTSDKYDKASHLDRPSVFRLNIGIRKQTYIELFGKPPARAGENGIFDTGHDFTALRQIMPHPIYAPMSWVCVLNPTEEIFQVVRNLLTEAYDLAVQRYEKRTLSD